MCRRPLLAAAGTAAASLALGRAGPHSRRATIRSIVRLELPCKRLVYTKVMTELADTFDSAFSKAVDLGNKIADKDKDADLWDIADGLLAGALQYWLYSRQPCGDPRCQDCMPISTAAGRMAELKRLVDQLATESEYFHTPTDANAGRA
jgi:hypothetical protein